MKNKILYSVICLLVVVIVIAVIGCRYYLFPIQQNSTVSEVALATTTAKQIPQIYNPGESVTQTIDSRQKFFRIRNAIPTEEGVSTSTTGVAGEYSYLFEEKRDPNISNIVGYFAHGAFAWYVPNWLANNWEVKPFGTEGMIFNPKVRASFDDFSDIIFSVSTSTELNNAENLHFTMLNNIPKDEIIISEVLLNKAMKDMISVQMENSTRIYHIAAYTADFKHISDLYFMDGNGRTLDLRFETKASIYPQFSNKIRDMVEGIGELKLPQG